MFVSPKIEIRETKKGKSLFTKKNIQKNEVIFEFEKRLINHRTKKSMQIDENKHQESADVEAIENFLNHSCESNGYVDFQDLTYRALRDIEPEEELTFNYLTTEWELFNKFKCECSSKHCFKQIRGFRYLTLDQQKGLEPLLSPFLKKKLLELKEAEN